MKHLNDLLLSVYCDNHQQIADIITPIERQATKLMVKWQTARTQMEKDELQRQIDEHSRAVELSMSELDRNEEIKKDEELMVSTLAMTDAAIKLLIEKGVFTDAEFKAQLETERANNLAVLKRAALRD
jgi:hypothetical protein